MAAFNKRPDLTPRPMRLKLAEYEYEVVYKAEKINTNADMLSRNSTPVLPFKISEKIDLKEAPPRRKSLRNRFPKDGTVTDRRKLKEIQPDINTQPAKTNKMRINELPSENINSD